MVKLKVFFAIRFNKHGRHASFIHTHTHTRHPDCNTNNIYITSQQDLIISYCKHNPSESDDEDPDSNLGSINVSNILNGKSLARFSFAHTRLLFPFRLSPPTRSYPSAPLCRTLFASLMLCICKKALAPQTVSE